MAWIEVVQCPARRLLTIRLIQQATSGSVLEVASRRPAPTSGGLLNQPDSQKTPMLSLARPALQRLLPPGREGFTNGEIALRSVHRDGYNPKTGRSQGPRMKCGWGSGAQLTGRNIRAHFTRCPNRPAASEHGATAAANAVRFGLRCPAHWVQYTRALLKSPKRPAASGDVDRRGRNQSRGAGAPRGPRMKCGWGCGAQFTGRNMRGHFTICAKRPTASEHVDRGGGA